MPSYYMHTANVNSVEHQQQCTQIYSDSQNIVTMQ